MAYPQDSNLTPLFEPRGIAVIGSMKEPYGEGYAVVQNLLDFGFSGSIHPVSRSAEEVLGIRAYPSIDDLDGPVDLAMMITPLPTVQGLVDQCGRKGVKTAIVATEGFAETGGEGVALQQQLVATAHRYGMRLLGPNTLGVLNTANGLVTSPYPIGRNQPVRGGAAYCSQTGLLTFGVHPIGDRAYPISKMCDFGNKSDLNEVELLDYLAADPDTKVIAMHLEDIKDGRRFIEAARRASAQKPVLILKPGRSEAGARAASSHTGSLAGDDQVYDKAFSQAGVIRLNTWRDFWEVPRTMALQPLPRGNRAAIITASGGGGVLLIDATQETGLVPAVFTAGTSSLLQQVSTRLGGNPVDIGPLMALRDDPFTLYEELVPVLLADPNVDCAAIVCHFNPVVVEVFRGLAPRMCATGKPVTLFGYGTDLREMEECGRQLEALGLPAYFDLEMAARALGMAARAASLRPDEAAA